jgi:hypothetical protein
MTAPAMARELYRPKSPFITVSDVASRYQCSSWTIHERARHGLIPHRKFSAGSSRLLFVPAELDLYDAGAELEGIDLKGGGRIVRPLQREERESWHDFNQT